MIDCKQDLVKTILPTKTSRSIWRNNILKKHILFIEGFFNQKKVENLEIWEHTFIFLDSKEASREVDQGKQVKDYLIFKYYYLVYKDLLFQIAKNFPRVLFFPPRYVLFPSLTPPISLAGSPSPQTTPQSLSLYIYISLEILERRRTMINEANFKAFLIWYP